MKYRNNRIRISKVSVFIFLTLFSLSSYSQSYNVISMDDYKDRVEAIWNAQIVGVMMGWQFEHKQAAVRWVDDYPDWIYRELKENDGYAPVDDDWYYEMANLRAFEKYGPNMTVQQLGKQWAENNVGVWGSSGQARKNILKGIQAPLSGHPRYNRLWFTMGAQNRSDLYGMMAPGMPNLAGRLTRDLGHINSYAEGTDGGVLVAGLISMAFFEKNHQELLKKVVPMLHPMAPHRQCLETIIAMAESGASAEECSKAVMEKWAIEYPATNAAVPNFGMVAISLWFGDGDFMKSLNVGFAGADFTDADCNASTAGVVLAAMHGMKVIPSYLVEAYNNRMKGKYIGHVELIPPVDESISELAKRTVEQGVKMIKEWGGYVEDDKIYIPVEGSVVTQALELFDPNQFVEYWNPDWKMAGAGYGAPGGGHRGIRGGTFFDDGILASYPRDEVRGCYMYRTLQLGDNPVLNISAGADPGRTWRIDVLVNNERIHKQLIDGGPALEWKDKEGNDEWFIPDYFPSPQDDYQRSKAIRTYQDISLDLSEYANQIVTLRIYQSPLVFKGYSGNAYWKEISIDEK